MRILIAFLILCSSFANAQTRQEFKVQQSEILIFIDDLAPVDCTDEEWVKSINEACEAWFKPSGFTIKRVLTKEKAEIVFSTADLVKRFGQCNRNQILIFPHIPNKADGIVILIEKDIKSMPHNNLLNVFKHEVGHAIGLEHNVQSIVSGEWPRPLDLTDYDRERIQELKRVLELQ